MAEVQWIKITTDMFDNRKIKHLRKLPEGNSIVLIWVMLLTMAGRCNASGMIFLTENIPYTTKMLADELDFEENTVILALEALSRMNMIVIDGELITITGWGEHQNLDQLESKKEYMRNYMKEYREKQKQKALTMGFDSKSNCKTNSKANVSSADKEEDKEEEKEVNIINNNSNSAAISLFVSEFGKLTPIITENIERCILNHGEELTVEAMKIAISAGSKNLSYVQGILRNWKEKGLKTVEDVRKAEKNYRKEKTSQSVKKTDSRRSARNELIFRGEQTPDDIDIAELQMKSLEKQLPTDKEVEAFRVSLQTDYPDFTPEQHECFVESFRNGTWKK